MNKTFYLIRYFLPITLTLLLFSVGCAQNALPVSENIPVEQQATITYQDTTVEQQTGETVQSTDHPVLPSHNEYSISLDVDPSEYTVSGIERIKFTNRTGADLDTLYFRYYPEAFTSDSEAKSESKPHMNIIAVTVDKDKVIYSITDELLKVTLDEILNNDDAIDILIQFDAQLPEVSDLDPRSDTLPKSGANERVLWCGNFLPILSVYDENGWYTGPASSINTPIYARSANFTVNITTPMKYTVAGTGFRTESESDGKKLTTFSAKMVRDFAFSMSADYTVSNLITPSGYEIEYFSFTDRNEPELVLKAASDYLEYYSRTVGAYLYPQLCIAETSLPTQLMTGAAPSANDVSILSYPQIIFISNPRDEAFDIKASDLVKAVGYQWFPYTIGNNVFEYPWMYEGIVSLLSRMNGATEQELSNKLQNVRTILSEKRVYPPDIARNVYAYNAYEDYNNIQRNKAMLMFYDIRHQMGTEQFSAFLREYYNKYSFRLSSPEIMKELLDQLSGISTEDETVELVSDRLDFWLNNKGLPALK